MKKFIDLQEATGTVSFTFGRFNPPTTGHEKLCDAVKKANPSDYKIFASQSQNPKKDPLQYAKKIAYMKKSFPKHKRNIIVSKSRNIFEILVELNSYENLIMVVGSDRVEELPSEYFQSVEPLSVHDNTPFSFIHCYSFALSPEDFSQPSGICNFSEIHNTDFEVTFKSSIGASKFKLFLLSTAFSIKA